MKLYTSHLDSDRQVSWSNFLEIPKSQVDQTPKQILSPPTSNPAVTPACASLPLNFFASLKYGSRVGIHNIHNILCWDLCESNSSIAFVGPTSQYFLEFEGRFKERLEAQYASRVVIQGVNLNFMGERRLLVWKHVWKSHPSSMNSGVGNLLAGG